MKALFFDIDGTLIDWRLGVLEVPRDAVCEMRRIRDEGNRLFVSSGRPRPFIGPEFRDLGCFDGYVLLNGGQIEYEGAVIYEELLGAEVTHTVCPARGGGLRVRHRHGHEREHRRLVCGHAGLPARASLVDHHRVRP